MAIWRIGMVPALCVAVSGCTPPPQTATAPSPKPAVAAVITTDGMYRGTSTRFRADRRDCPHPGLVTLYVQGGQFEYRWTPQIDVLAVIDPDGTVHGEGPDVTLSGRRDGGLIGGDVTNGACGLHFTARKTF